MPVSNSSKNTTENKTEENWNMLLTYLKVFLGFPLYSDNMYLKN